MHKNDIYGGLLIGKMSRMDNELLYKIDKEISFDKSTFKIINKPFKPYRSSKKKARNLSTQNITLSTQNKNNEPQNTTLKRRNSQGHTKKTISKKLCRNIATAETSPKGRSVSDVPELIVLKPQLHKTISRYNKNSNESPPINKIEKRVLQCRRHTNTRKSLDKIKTVKIEKEKLQKESCKLLTQKLIREKKRQLRVVLSIRERINNESGNNNKAPTPEFENKYMKPKFNNLS